MPKKLTLKEIRDRSLKMGFIFLDKQYRGSTYLHVFKCIIDKQAYESTFNKINSGRLLPCCAIRRRREVIESKIGQISKESLSLGFIFMDNKFLGVTHKHSFKCIMDGEIHQSTFESISRGHGLWCCKLRKTSENQKGIKNVNWNSKLSVEDRLDRRHGSFDRKWKTQVKERDSHKCIICNGSEKLHAHHLESYSSNKRLRYNIDNGITLCQTHHVDFHRAFGHSDNTSSQFVKFLCLGTV